MIAFEHFEQNNNSPIYLQIVWHVKRGILSGDVCDGDELPSRRNLSALLSVNPMTVQKAYRQLEEEGLIHSETGAKSRITVTQEDVERVRQEMSRQDLGNSVRMLKSMGLSREEMHQMIDLLWDQEERSQV